MYSSIYSVAVNGLDTRIVNVETDAGSGLPYFEMSGYLAAQVRESKERIRVAIKNSGVDLKPQRIVVNISPADIRKGGTGFDLPIAVGILAANKIVDMDRLKDSIILGELSLDGTVNDIKGVLPCVIEAEKQGFKRCFVPKGNLFEGSVTGNISVYGIDSLKELVSYLDGEIDAPLSIVHSENDFMDKIYQKKDASQNYMDFSDICGQMAAKRATLVAAAGLHNIIYTGAPGCGKTMLAERIPGILPNLTFKEALELTKIYSIAGCLNEKNGKYMITGRPFRSPHHSVSQAGLLGGGAVPRPGEITLAHGGVLFLDELTEFPQQLLETLRQPLEDRKIRLVRLGCEYVFPSDFMLAAAINPCKCGYYPDRTRCMCTEHDIARYLGRISQPMWDRFDINVYVRSVAFDELASRKKGEDEYDTANMKKLVEKARVIQSERFKDEEIDFNSQMNASQIRKYCKLGMQQKELMEKAYNKLGLTARGYSRILKVSRTIADLDESESITCGHISEAVSYRNDFRM